MSGFVIVLVVGGVLIGLFAFDLSLKVCGTRPAAGADERAKKAIRDGPLN